MTSANVSSCDVCSPFKFLSLGFHTHIFSISCSLSACTAHSNETHPWPGENERKFEEETFAPIAMQDTSPLRLN